MRLAFVKIAARVTELITRIKVSLPSSFPDKQSLARFAGCALALPRKRRGDVPTIEPSQSTANAVFEGPNPAPSATRAHVRSAPPNCPPE